MSTTNLVSPEVSTSATAAPVVPIADVPQKLATLIQRYGCGTVQFSGEENALYERHLVFDNVIDRSAADTRTQFEVFARSVRDISEYANRYMEGEPEFSGLTIREIHGAEEPDASERSTLDKNKLSQAASQSRERLQEHV